MDTINQKYEIEIEVLTPVCIGAGAEKDWVEGVDFIIKNDKIYKISLQKIIEHGFDINTITTYIAEHNSKALANLLGDSLKSISDLVIPLPASTTNPIKACIKNELSNNPLIPGSSLKGAIRSHIYKYLGGKEKDGSDVFGKTSQGENFMRFIKISDAEFERNELVNTKIFNLHHLQDTTWEGGWKHERNETKRTYKPTGFNTIYECIMPGEKGYASIMSSTSGYKKLNASLTRPDPLQIRKNDVLDIQNLFARINQDSKGYIEKEIAFFQKFSQSEHAEEIIDSLKAILQQTKACLSTNTSCIIKMAAGSGFHSITGDWQFNDYTKAPLDRKRNRDANPKSRKIAIYGDNTFSLMGFVKLKCLSESEIQKRNKTIAQKNEERQLNAQRNQIKTLLHRAESLTQQNQYKEAEDTLKGFNLYSETLKAEKEAEYEELLQKVQSGLQEIQRIERAYQEKAEKYKASIKTANEAILQNDSESALRNFIDAQEINPNGEQLADLKQNIYEKLLEEGEKAISNEDYNLATKKCEAARELFPAKDEHKQLETRINRAKSAVFGLSFLEEKNANDEYKVNNFNTAKDRINDYLKKQKLERIPESQTDILQTALIRLYKQAKPRDKKSWNEFNDSNSIWQKNIARWIGKDKAEEIYNNLFSEQQ